MPPAFAATKPLTFPKLAQYLFGTAIGTFISSVQNLLEIFVTFLPLFLAILAYYRTDIAGKIATLLWLLAVTTGCASYVVFSKTGYADVTYNNLIVSGPTYMETITPIDTAHATGTGDIGGKIIDGTVQGGDTGVSGVTINLRPGVNQTTVSITASTTSDGTGTYGFTTLAAGIYTAELVKTGWVTTYFTVYCLGGGTVNNQNGTMTPALGTGEIRIVLTWGATPSDLDSHLTGPKTPGDPTNYSYAETGRFHTYFSHKIYEYNGTTYAELDVDDLSSYGPETTTIYSQQSGTYRYSVFDYDNQDNADSYYLTNSGAQVKVYQGSTLIRTYNVPTGKKGTLWTVFEINGSTITPVNTVTYHEGGASYDIKSLQSRSNAGLMKNLPKK